MAESEALKKTRLKYKKEHSKLISARFYEKKDGDLIAWLDEQESINSYIKQLIREDYERKHPTRYWYGMRLREYGIGCQPAGAVEHINGNGRTLKGGKYWSLVCYERELKDAEVKAYDLDRVEEPKDE